jgi:two-component system, chemotaxis family, chemotaxis protein CheY
MKKVLVVDDATTVRMYHRQVLEQAGFEVDEAVNGYEALEKALTAGFDALVVDVNMPKMDGYTLLKSLRAEQGLRLVPALMVSTEAEVRDSDEAYLCGADAYMVKPVRPDELVAVVRMLTAGAAQ